MDTMDPSDLFPQLSDELVHGMDQFIEAQTRFLESWQQNLAQETDDEVIASGAKGIVEAYEIWLNASREWTEQLVAVAEGEELDPRNARDIWLRAANESAQSMMSTTAFAQMTGQSVQDGLELQRQRDEAIQTMLEAMGVASTHSIEEVGDRLIELERRQHAVEQKLDRLLDHLDES